MIKRGSDEIMTEREVGEDGHSHAQDLGLDPDPDPDQGTKASHFLEMREMAIRLLDGKSGGQMTIGEAPGEMIGTKEMNRISCRRT